MQMHSIVLVSTVAISSVLCAREQEKKIAKKDLPAPVLAAFQKTYPKATIKGLNEEIKDGKTYFEIESQDGKTERDLLYLADGSVAEIEESMGAADLPQAVKVAVEAKYPKARISKVEKVTQGTTVHFDLNVKAAQGAYQVEAEETGKILKEHKATSKKK